MPQRTIRILQEGVGGGVRRVNVYVCGSKALQPRVAVKQKFRTD